MTQDEIIRMAREAGFSVGLNDPIIYAAHERFAALVAAQEREKQAEQEPVAWGCVVDGELEGFVPTSQKDINRNKGVYETPLYAAPVSIEAAVKEAVLAEREACAKVVASGVLGHGECAAAIRARGE